MCVWFQNYISAPGFLLNGPMILLGINYFLQILCLREHTELVLLILILVTGSNFIYIYNNIFVCMEKFENNYRIYLECKITFIFTIIKAQVIHPIKRLNLTTANHGQCVCVLGVCVPKNQSLPHHSSGSS